MKFFLVHFAFIVALAVLSFVKCSPTPPPRTSLLDGLESSLKHLTEQAVAKTQGMFNTSGLNIFYVSLEDQDEEDHDENGTHYHHHSVEEDSMVTYPHQNARFARLYKRMADDMSVEEEEAVSSEEIETTSDATEQLNTNSGNDELTTN